ncbi:hypothetical protein B0H94_11068 [Salsuginibacillus halophilus]|uniref:Gas vesicle protein n=1 Tax=Salsuginibacillus halophilus TaxID=517424 RepID=A0A2P8HBJ6_9BACI|nr:hypothetical protein [Salsuginibacillus halophilus]PSL43592.1 hypothetical protein B0H94_11068 [Salsuginibacillus halophilus]
MGDSTNKRLCAGLTVAGVAACSLLLVNKDVRTKVFQGTKQAAKSVNDASVYLRDHREEVITQLRDTSEQVSSLLKSANQDVQYILQRASHLKEATSELADTTKEAAQELKEIKEEAAAETEDEAHHEEVQAPAENR